MAEANLAEVEAKVDAAFDAGFGNTPPAAIPSAKVANEPVPTPTPAATPPAPVPEKPQYVRLTKQDWDNTKAAAGKVSSLESQLAKLTGSLPKADQIVQTVMASMRSGELSVSDDDFAEMAADFPELAKTTRSALEKIFKKAGIRGSDPNASPANAVNVKAEFETLMTAKEMNALTKRHPDWSIIVGRPSAEGEGPTKNDFRSWLARQPADYQKEISETDSPAEVHSAIDMFKASQNRRSAASGSDRAAARRAVIEDAVTPRADGNPPPLNSPISADEAFSNGFKAVRRY